jgi:hypothetical protein
LEFVLAAGDGMAVESGDPCQQGDASAAVLSREEADEETSDPLVGGGEEAVDPPVLACRGTVGMLLAGRALAGVEDLLGFLLGHATLPP